MENRLIKVISCISLSVILLSGCSAEKESAILSEPDASSDYESSAISNISSEPANNSESEGSKPTESLESSDITDVSSVPDQLPDEEIPYIPADDELVLIKDYIPTVKFDIRYATVNNFTGQIIYDTADTYLRYGTVKKLMAVQEELEEKGLSLLIWDAYRPTEAQQKLWDICPDPNFVSDPKKGFSGHCRGGAIDITVVTSNGELLEMPSDFDEFTALADRDYSDVSAIAAENSQMLEDLMEKHGFSGYRKEWWHYSDTVTYPVAGQEE